jgi:hypothetical protein
MLGHLEKSVEEKEELWLGEPRHSSRKRKGDTLALSWVQENLQNNESHCYSVSTAKEAHTVPPPVVQISHTPSIPSPTCSKTRSEPSCGRFMAAPSTQLSSFEGSCFPELEELKLRHDDAVNNRRLNANAETEKKLADLSVKP